MKQPFFLLLALLAAFYSEAAIPDGYYSSLNGLKDESLKDELHDIISPHTKLSYNSLWDYYPETDAYPERVNGQLLVWDMYSDNWNDRQYFYYGGTKGLNREHSVPKSWWGPSNEAINGYLAGTDIMHIFPSDGDANMAKSNYPLGEVGQTTFDNGTSKVGYPVNGQGGGASRVFEPDDQYKGDFARVYFYMVTCYQQYEWRYQYMFNNTSYLTLNQWASDMLLDWSRNDPVDQKEIDRNEEVFSIQGNRNPFVDDPELAEYIWGNRKGETYSAEHYSGDPVLISPSTDTQYKFEAAEGASQQLDVIVRGENLVGSLTVTLYGTDKSMFSVAASNIPASSVNSDAGFTLRITYSPKAVGEHSANLLFSDGGLTGSFAIPLSGTAYPVPSLSQLKALPATNIEGTNYRAEWIPASETIDFYVVTRTIYDGTSVSTTEHVAEAEEPFMDFTDLKPGTKHTYSVQSSRLGYMSIPSNVITIDASSVSGLTTDKPLAVATYDNNEIRFICDERHTGCHIYDSRGMLIRSIDTIEPGMSLTLPYGVYFVTTNECSKPIKIFVR